MSIFYMVQRRKLWGRKTLITKSEISNCTSEVRMTKEREIGRSYEGGSDVNELYSYA